MEFFRQCPGCGRRFHIKLVGKKLVNQKTEPVVTLQRVSSGYPPTFEDKTMIIDIDDFQYDYKCGHCGHEWSEKHTEKKEVSQAKPEHHAD